MVKSLCASNVLLANGVRKKARLPFGGASLCCMECGLGALFEEVGGVEEPCAVLCAVFFKKFCAARFADAELIACLDLHLLEKFATDTHLQAYAQFVVAQLVGAFAVASQHRNHGTGKRHWHQRAFEAVQVVIAEFQVDGNVDIVESGSFGTDAHRRPRLLFLKVKFGVAHRVEQTSIYAETDARNHQFAHDTGIAAEHPIAAENIALSEV